MLFRLNHGLMSISVAIKENHGLIFLHTLSFIVSSVSPYQGSGITTFEGVLTQHRAVPRTVTFIARDARM